MKEEAEGGRAATTVGHAEYPAEDPLCHLECLWVGHEEEDEGAVEGVFGLEGCVGCAHLYWSGVLSTTALEFAGSYHHLVLIAYKCVAGFICAVSV